VWSSSRFGSTLFNFEWFSQLDFELQGKLELITGIPVVNQKISILASENDPRVLADLTDDTKPLGFYGLTDWQVLKVSTRLDFVRFADDCVCR